MNDGAAVQAENDTSDHAHGGLSHVMPVPVLLAVFAALVVLTVLTVTVTWVNLGEWNLWIAMGIATLKASLVALFFMHLLYDNRFNGLLLVTALAFLALFISLTLLDRVESQPAIEQYQQANTP